MRITFHRYVEVVYTIHPTIKYSPITRRKDSREECAMIHRIQYPTPPPTSQRQLSEEMTFRREDGSEYKYATSIMMGADAMDMNPTRMKAK
jgi:hypothetical protein